MHYIIGTTIIISEAQSTSSGSITDVRSPRKINNTTPFETGVEYSLYNIKPVEGVFEYKFYAQTTQHVVDLRFNCPSDADNYICKLKGEALPNYTSFHVRRGD